MIAPSLKAFDPLDGGLVDFKKSSQGVLSHRTHPYRLYITLCQLVLWVIFPSQAVESFLRHTVFHVFRVSADEKVVRIAALPVVALVQHHETGLEFPIVNDPRKDVSSHLLAFEFHLSVSVSRQATRPLHAPTSRSCEFGQEPGFRIIPSATPSLNGGLNCLSPEACPSGIAAASIDLHAFVVTPNQSTM
jgi:hypothetical protein